MAKNEKRRQFLIFGSLLGLSTCIDAKDVDAKDMSSFDRNFKKAEATIRAVQEHMFPEKSKLPSAKKMRLAQFLYETVRHDSFDKDIRLFIIEGAEELMKRENGKFVVMSQEGKEKALRDYEETSYGSAWLSRIMTLSMEGLFSDPIYGSNVKEAGWQALGAYGGTPRPKIRYIGR